MKFTFGLCVMMIASSAAAEDLVGRPASCELISTSQLSDCSLDNRFRCTEGVKSYFRFENYQTAGLDAVITADENYAIRDMRPVSGDGFEMTSQSGTPLKDVISTGRGKQVSVGEFILFGLRRPLTIDLSLSYAGKSVELAGRTFQIIDGNGTFVLPEPVGGVGVTVVFGYDPEHDLLVEVEYSSDFDKKDEPKTRLMELSLEGQKGFGDVAPRYGCGELSQISIEIRVVPV